MHKIKSLKSQKTRTKSQKTRTKKPKDENQKTNKRKTKPFRNQDKIKTKKRKYGGFFIKFPKFYNSYKPKPVVANVANVANKETIIKNIFMDALNNDSVESLQNILSENENYHDDLVNARYNNDHKTGLMIACQDSNINIVKFFIKNRADVNIQDDWEYTALMFACKKGDIEIVRILIENGANVNILGNWGYTALKFACLYNNIDIVKYLIENGADVNAKNEHNETVLMIACQYSNIDIVKYLIDHGANKRINIIHNKNGYRALDFANEQNKKIAEYLKTVGAITNPDKTDQQYRIEPEIQ